MSKRKNALRFSGGRVRWVVASRHELARKICSGATGEWYRLAADEQDAADALCSWGMIERHPQTPDYVRWSILHERPRFGRQCVTLALFGAPVHHLSEAQRDLIVAAQMAAKRGGHDVLASGDKRIKKMVMALVTRGLLELEKRDGGVWRVRIASTYPGKPAAVATAPQV